MHVVVCVGQIRRSLTVLGGSVAKHHPQVTAADVFDGNCHLGGRLKETKVMEINVNTGLYIWKARRLIRTPCVNIFPGR